MSTSPISPARRGSCSSAGRRRRPACSAPRNAATPLGCPIHGSSRPPRWSSATTLTSAAPTPPPPPTHTGPRVPGLRLTAPRARAPLPTLCQFRLQPAGFTNHDLRHHLAPLLGHTPEQLTTSQASYDVRRLRVHGLITRI